MSELREPPPPLTLSTSPLHEAPRARLQVSARVWVILTAVVGLGYWLLISWIAVAEYDTYNSTSRDLAVYLQVIWNTANAHPFATTLLEHNRLHVAEHLAGLIALASPLYRAIPDPRLLLMVQQAVLTLTGIPVFLWARHRLGPGWAALLTICYFAMPTLTEVALDAFYPVVFTALPLGFAAYFALRSRPAAAYILGLIALPIEEEAGLVALGIGLMMIFSSHSRFFFARRRRHTRYWRDWSSDVCSSDLVGGFEPEQVVQRRGGAVVGLVVLELLDEVIGQSHVGSFTDGPRRCPRSAGSRSTP